MRIKGLNESLIQQYIAEALLLLMKKKPYEKISIGEITDRAGVNRSSYYRHFEVKEDIIRFFLKSIMAEYMAEYQNLKTKTFRNYLLSMFTSFYKYNDELLLLHKNGMSYLLLDVLNDCFRFSEIPDGIGATEQFKVSYHIGGIYNNMFLWMEHGMLETAEQMTDIAISFKPETSFTLLNVK